MRYGTLALLLGATTAPTQQIARAIAEAEKLGARTGVVAVTVAGRTLHQHRAREAFTPASNLKILTAAAVLQGLGADFEFTTRAELRDGRLRLYAGGDPNWIAGTEHSGERLFRALVAALQRCGVDRVRAIELVPGSFQGPNRPPTWPADQLDTWYCAPTGAFVLQQGTFVLRIEPAASSAEVAITAPLVSVPIEGRIATIATRAGAVYGASDRGDRVLVQGRIWRGSPPVEVRVAVGDPVAWFELALQQALRAGGIRVTAEAPAATLALLEHRTPLQPALQRLLQDSSNFDAEQCLRVLGAAQRRDGSLQGGVDTARAMLAECVPDTGGGFVMVDGSGLSRQNRVTPELLASVLRRALSGPTAQPLAAALPVAGRSGTLQDRFRGSPVTGRVRAKTGWIRGASALSGVLERRDGVQVVFSILMNYDPQKSGLNQQLKLLQERIVEALDGEDS